MSDDEGDYDQEAAPEGEGSETPMLGEDGFPVITARKLQQQMNPMQQRMMELKKKQEARHRLLHTCINWIKAATEAIMAT